jgi:putative tricarboxylic transport membrane protein
LSDGDLLPFVTRPLSLILALFVVYTFVTNVKTINDAMVRGRNALFARVARSFRRAA